MIPTRIRTLGGRIGAISHVVTEQHIAALTFDDGPHPEYTPHLLEILAEHEAHATFFMVGEAASKHPGLVEQVAKSGHLIGNHSWNHKAFPLISRDERQSQLMACAHALAPYESRYFRPPYGEQDVRSYFDTKRSGYETVGWNVDIGDWCDSNPAGMATRLAQAIRPGSIVLLHDALFDGGQPTVGPPLENEAVQNRAFMLEAVARLLDMLRNTMRFVTLAELLAHGRSRRQGWSKIRAIQ